MGITHSPTRGAHPAPCPKEGLREIVNWKDITEFNITEQRRLDAHAMHYTGTDQDGDEYRLIVRIGFDDDGYCVVDYTAFTSW